MRHEHHPASREFLSHDQTWEVDLAKKNDREHIISELRNVLGEEAAEQLIFVAKQLSSSKDFANHCNHATQELGKGLGEHFGGEESFFDLCPSATYADVRSEHPLEIVGYRGNFHSVGVISAAHNKQPISCIVDTTYFTVAGSRKKERAALFALVKGDTAQALKKLASTYGGQWETHFVYNKAKNTFQSVD